MKVLLIIKHNFSLFLFGSVLCFCASIFILTKPIPQSRTEYLPPPKIIKNFSLGLSRQWADSLWLRAIQDMDYCEQKITENECKGKSWLFQVLDLATELDPQIEPGVYQIAGLALTVIISDYAGASQIFDKAVVQHPSSWPILYAAAYHALYEEKDKLKAARLYESAGKNGAPTWVFSLAGRLASDGGDKEYSQQILQGMIASQADPAIIKRLQEKLSQ